MKTDFSKIESLISDGKSTEAQTQILKIASKKIARDSVAPLARLARRVNLVTTSLKLLNPIVRETSRTNLAPTQTEITEYAAALIWVGATLEAKLLLAKCEQKEDPNLLLTRAYSHMFEWDYQSAIPFLESYLEKDLLDFERRVGETNLAACYIQQRELSKAEPILETLKIETRNNYLRLYANALELSSQRAIYNKDFATAEKSLKEAASILKGSALLDALFIQKWLLVKNFLQKGKSKKVLSGFSALKENAATFQHWETIRECDKFIAIAGKDTSLYQHIYFGTPYDSYRARLKEDFKSSTSLPKTHFWQLGNKKLASQNVLNLFSGDFKGEPTNLKTGKLNHRLLHLLAADFYKPISTGSLFAGVFPGEHFNPYSSPHRIHQAIASLKVWLKENGIPLTVEADEHGYCLKSPSGISIFLTERESRRHPQLRVLFDSFGESPFSTQEAAKVLSVPLRSLQRFLSGMVVEGLLEVSGSTRNLRYQLKRKRK